MSGPKSDSGKSHDTGKERGDDRRVAQQDVTRDRRKESDRRDLRYGVKFVTSGSLVELEDWLDENCSESWRLVFLDMDESLDSKDVQIMFASKSDKDKFVATHSR